MIKEGLKTSKQEGIILLISIHGVLTSHQSKSVSKKDQFDIGYNSPEYGKLHKHPSEDKYFCEIKKGKVKAWVELIESVMTDEQIKRLGDVPAVFKPKDL